MSQPNHLRIIRHIGEPDPTGDVAWPSANGPPDALPVLDSSRDEITRANTHSSEHTLRQVDSTLELLRAMGYSFSQ